MVTVDGTDDEDVAAAVDALKVEYATGDNADSVTQDVTLAKNGENDVAITWASSDLSVIGADGTVTRPGTDIIVILTATLAKGEASDTKEFTLTVIGTFTLAHITSIDDTDNDAYALDFPENTAIAIVGGTTYLFVTGYNDDGVSVFSVATDGTLTHTATVYDSDNAEYELNEAYAVTTAAVGTTTYLFVGGNEDNGVSVFSVANDGTLTYATSISDNTTYNLGGPLALTTAAIGSATYLFVGGFDDSGISVFSVGTDGSLTHTSSIEDSATNELNRVIGITTAVIGDTTYLFAAGRDDGGVSVFSVDNSGMLTHVTSVDDSDNADYQLAGAFGITTATLEGTTYLIVSSYFDNGITVFSVSNSGMLTYITSVADTDNEDYMLRGSTSAITSAVGDGVYLFVNGRTDNSISIFGINTDGTLTYALTVDDTDNSAYELDETGGLSIAKVGETVYLFVAGRRDDGISVFSVSE